MSEWFIAFSAGVAATVVGGQILDAIKNYKFQFIVKIKVKRR